MHTSQGSGAAGHTAGEGRLHLGPSASGPEVQAFAVHGAPRGSCMRGGWEGSWLSPALTWTSGGQRGAGGGLAVSCSASLIGHPHRQREHQPVRLPTCRGAFGGRGRPGQSGLGAGAPCWTQGR